MAKKLSSLNCNIHICKRVAEACGLKEFSILLPHLSLKQPEQTAHVSLALPIKILNQETRSENCEGVLNMKTDEIIHKIGSNHENDNILFYITKQNLMKSLFDSYLDPPIKEGNSSSKKTVLVEYSSPNIAKPFHVGHLRSTIVGNFVANIMDVDHTVKRLNYLGDWGTQIGFIKAGLDASNVTDVTLLENPMKEMYKAYTLAYSDKNMLNKAKEIFSNLEKGLSPELCNEWENIRLLTIEHLKKTYKSFGVVFDEYTYESKYKASKIGPVFQLLEMKKMTSYEDNCLVLNMGDSKIPLCKSDGTTLYLMRDIAAALDRIQVYNCDSIMYVVDKSQSDHINKLSYAVSMLAQKDIIKYIPFGRITGMSTRKGTSIFLDDILNETVDKMAEQQLKSPNTRTLDPEVTKIIGVTALIVYILRQRRNRDFAFSWNTAMQGTGDTGVKLQYTHSRLCSLEHRCNVSLPKESDPSLLKEPIIFELIFELARYPEILKSCQEHMESSFLVSYLFKLCNLVSRCLKALPVKGQSNDVASQRLLLFHTARCQINSAMKILGIQPLSEM